MLTTLEEFFNRTVIVSIYNYPEFIKDFLPGFVVLKTKILDDRYNHLGIFRHWFFIAWTCIALNISNRVHFHSLTRFTQIDSNLTGENYWNTFQHNPHKNCQISLFAEIIWRISCFPLMPYDASNCLQTSPSSLHPKSTNFSIRPISFNHFWMSLRECQFTWAASVLNCRHTTSSVIFRTRAPALWSYFIT